MWHRRCLHVLVTLLLHLPITKKRDSHVVWRRNPDALIVAIVIMAIAISRGKVDSSNGNGSRAAVSPTKLNLAQKVRSAGVARTIF